MFDGLGMRLVWEPPTITSSIFSYDSIFSCELITTYPHFLVLRTHSAYIAAVYQLSDLAVKRIL